MRAFGLEDEGSAAGVIEIPVPEPGPGEVRVRVRASSFNGYDAFVASGAARGTQEHRYPVVVGKDYSGTIDTVGDGVSRFAAGDDVAGIVPPMPFVGVGSYAESVVVPAEGFIEPKPSSLSFEQAASVGLAALTALVSVDAIDPSKGEVVLVVGATGGVGSYAVQLAARRGATVIASALPEDEGWIHEFGAAEIADYSGDVPGTVRSAHPDGLDGLIVAAHLGDEFDPTTELVKDGGKVASAVGGDLDALASRGITAAGVFAQGHPDAFPRVLEMAASGELVVPIRRTFSFEELPEALGLVGKRSSRGKFAVTISS